MAKPPKKMGREKFMLVSLQEEQSKQLTQILSNNTARKILDLLADNEATESQLAKALNLPLSTVHYNIQGLVKGGLVVADEYHYSKKGKEILHYKLANQYIIIAPKSTYGIKEKLKSILPAFVGISAIGLILQYVLSGTTVSMNKPSFSAAPAVMESADVAKAPTDVAADEAVSQGASAVIEESASQAVDDMARESVQDVAQAVAPQIVNQTSFDITFFILGAALALFLFLLIDWVRKK